MTVIFLLFSPTLYNALF